eukprot:3312440-Pyramimonas_sp.AAC.1
MDNGAKRAKVLSSGKPGEYPKEGCVSEDQDDVEAQFEEEEDAGNKADEPMVRYPSSSDPPTISNIIVQSNQSCMRHPDREDAYKPGSWFAKDSAPSSGRNPQWPFKIEDEGRTLTSTAKFAIDPFGRRLKLRSEFSGMFIGIPVPVQKNCQLKYPVRPADKPPVMLYKEDEPLRDLHKYLGEGPDDGQLVEVRIPAENVTSSNRQVRGGRVPLSERARRLNLSPCPNLCGDLENKIFNAFNIPFELCDTPCDDLKIR